MPNLLSKNLNLNLILGKVGPSTVVVAIENFLYEVNEDIWMDMSCLVMSDPGRKINLQSFSQPTTIEAGYVEKLKAGTPDNYPKQWSGKEASDWLIILNTVFSLVNHLNTVSSLVR